MANQKAKVLSLDPCCPMNRADEKAEEQEHINTPNGKAYTGTVSREQWMEMMNAADPFEQSLRAQKEKSSGSKEENKQ